MSFAFKYRLYPTKPQTAFLEGELREACSLYNAAKQERDDAWKTCRKSINYYDQANQLKAMRADGCLTLANFSCCQDVLRRVDKTYKAFFARVQARREAGISALPLRTALRQHHVPVLRRWLPAARQRQTARSRARGTSKSSCTGPWKAKIKTVTIKREAGRWFVCFSVERESTPLPASAR